MILKQMQGRENKIQFVFNFMKSETNFTLYFVMRMTNVSVI